MAAKARIISGFNGNNLIYGGWAADRIYGDYGDDRIEGAAGSDRVSGGGGNDLLYGGRGDDQLGDARGLTASRAVPAMTRCGPAWASAPEHLDRRPGN